MLEELLLLKETPLLFIAPAPFLLPLLLSAAKFFFSEMFSCSCLRLCFPVDRNCGGFWAFLKVWRIAWGWLGIAWPRLAAVPIGITLVGPAALYGWLFKAFAYLELV